MAKRPTSRVHVKSQPGGLFDPKRIGVAIEDGRDRLGIDVMDIATYVWEHRKDRPESARTEWYKRVSETSKDKKFTAGEMERAVQYVRTFAAEKRPDMRVPSLWPLVDWATAEAFDAFRLLAKTMK